MNSKISNEIRLRLLDGETYSFTREIDPSKIQEANKDYMVLIYRKPSHFLWNVPLHPGETKELLLADTKLKNVIRYCFLNNYGRMISTGDVRYYAYKKFSNLWDSRYKKESIEEIENMLDGENYSYMILEFLNKEDKHEKNIICRI